MHTTENRVKRILFRWSPMFISDKKEKCKKESNRNARQLRRWEIWEFTQLVFINSDIWTGSLAQPSIHYFVRIPFLRWILWKYFFSQFISATADLLFSTKYARNKFYEIFLHFYSINILTESTEKGNVEYMGWQIRGNHSTAHTTPPQFNHEHYDTPTPPPLSRPLTLSAMAALCWHYESIAAKIRGINVIYWRTNLSHANEIYFHLITINIFPRDPRNILTI